MTREGPWVGEMKGDAMWRDAIVVGADGSPTADIAVAHAAALATELGGEVHVVCSYQTRLAGGWVGTLGGVAVAELTAVEQARTHAEEIVAAARRRLEHLELSVHTHVRGDEPARRSSPWPTRRGRG